MVTAHWHKINDQRQLQHDKFFSLIAGVPDYIRLVYSSAIVTVIQNHWLFMPLEDEMTRIIEATRTHLSQCVSVQSHSWWSMHLENIWIERITVKQNNQTIVVQQWKLWFIRHLRLYSSDSLQWCSKRNNTKK